MTTESLDSEEFARALLALISQVMLNRWLWHAFGFRHHPMRGRIWDRFVKSDRLKDERFLMREFGVLGFERVIRSTAKLNLGTHRLPLLARVYEHLVMGVRPYGPFWEALSFSSADDCAKYLAVGLRKYLNSAYSAYASIFIARAAAHTDGAIKPKWLVGAAGIFTMSSSPLPWVSLSIEEAAGGKVLTNNPTLEQRGFMDLLKEAMGEGDTQGGE